MDWLWSSVVEGVSMRKKRRALIIAAGSRRKRRETDHAQKSMLNTNSAEFNRAAGIPHRARPCRCPAAPAPKLPLKRHEARVAGPPLQQRRVRGPCARRRGNSRAPGGRRAGPRGGRTIRHSLSMAQNPSAIVSRISWATPINPNSLLQQRLSHMRAISLT